MLLYMKNLTDETSPSDIRSYFQGLSIPAGGIHITRESSAFITFDYIDDLTKAYKKKDTAKLGSHIVKLLCSDEEKELELKRIDAIRDEPEAKEDDESTFPWRNSKKAEPPAEKEGDYPWRNKQKSSKGSEASPYADDIDFRVLAASAGKDRYDVHSHRDRGGRHGVEDVRTVHMAADLKQIRANVEQDLRDLRESLSSERSSSRREVLTDRHNSKLIIAIDNPDAVRKRTISEGSVGRGLEKSSGYSLRDAEWLDESSLGIEESVPTGDDNLQAERDTKRHKPSDREGDRSGDRDREHDRDMDRDREHDKDRDRRHSSESRSRHESRGEERSHDPKHHTNREREGDRSSRSHHRSRSRERRHSSHEDRHHSRTRHRSRGHSRDRDRESRHDRHQDRDRYSHSSSVSDSHRSRTRRNSERRSPVHDQQRKGYFILMKNLPTWADIAWVHRFFERCQYLSDETKLICNESGPLYAYIEVENPVDVKLACQLDGTKVDKNPMSVRSISADTFLEDLRNVQDIERKSGVLRIISSRESMSPEPPPQNSRSSWPPVYIPTPIGYAPPPPGQYGYPQFNPTGSWPPPLPPGYSVGPHMAPVRPPFPQQPFNPYPSNQAYTPPIAPRVPPPGYGPPAASTVPVTAALSTAPAPVPLRPNLVPIIGKKKLMVNSASLPVPSPLAVSVFQRGSQVADQPTEPPVPEPLTFQKVPKVLPGPENWVVPLPTDSPLLSGLFARSKSSPYLFFDEFHFSKISTEPGAPLPEIPSIPKEGLEKIYFQGLPRKGEKFIFDIVKQLDRELGGLDYIHIKIEPTGSCYNILASVKKPVSPSLPYFASVNGFICPVEHESQWSSCQLCRRPAHRDPGNECVALTLDKKPNVNYLISRTNILHPEYNHWFSYNNRYNTNVLAAFAHPNEIITPKNANEFIELYNVYNKLLKIRRKLLYQLRKVDLTQDILVVGTDPILTTGIDSREQLLHMKSPYIPGLNLAGKALMTLRKEIEMKVQQRDTDTAIAETYPEPDPVPHLQIKAPGDSFKVTKPFHEIAKMKSKQADAQAKEKEEKKVEGEDMLDNSKESTSSNFFFSLFDDDL